jgi:peptide deformylase
MEREIVKDEEVLKRKSARYDVKRDWKVEVDLIDTAEANGEKCVGLAAIQIGEAVRLIVAKFEDGKFRVMRNPLIVERSAETYVARETCLSLEGEREVTRHRAITVLYEDQFGKQRKLRCRDFLAEVVQHECDHLVGILI